MCTHVFICYHYVDRYEQFILSFISLLISENASFDIILSEKHVKVYRFAELRMAMSADDLNESN